MQRLYDHFLTRTYTVSQLVWSQAFPVHIWIVSCDVAWPPVSSLPFVRVRVYVCLGCACSSEVSVLVHSSYFVGPWSLRQQLACALEEETICFILSADKPRGMTPASYVYIHTIYRYDKILKVIRRFRKQDSCIYCCKSSNWHTSHILSRLIQKKNPML